MRFVKYFKTGQKILLRLADPEAKDRYEALTGFFQEAGGAHFDILLPYRSHAGEAFPFSPGMPLEIFADAMGVGIRVTASFRELLDGDLIRVDITSDAQIFQRRLFPRIDTRIGIRYTKGQGKLRSFREQWEKNLRILERNPDLSKLPPFPTMPANLSAGGIRFNIKTPVEIADLCLLLLQLDEKDLPVCVLAEVVWVGDREVNGRRAAGMRFVSVLEADQQKIERLVRERSRQMNV